MLDSLIEEPLKLIIPSKHHVIPSKFGYYFRQANNFYNLGISETLSYFFILTYNAVCFSNKNLSLS